MSSETHAIDVKGLVEHLRQALNDHNIEAYQACFHETYASDQPAHPARSFHGNEQVRKNWTAIVDGVPDVQAEVLRWAAADDIVWIEWRWYGTRVDGSAFDMRGVTLYGIEAGRCVWGRLYMELVDRTEEGVDAMISAMTGGQRREP